MFKQNYVLIDLILVKYEMKMKINFEIHYNIL